MPFFPRMIGGEALQFCCPIENLCQHLRPSNKCAFLLWRIPQGWAGVPIL